MKLLLLFVLLPFIELALLMKIGEIIGFWPTIGIIIATGVVGATLAKHQGLRVLNQVRQELAAGKIPSDALINGLFVLVAGAFLVTPGVITDILGFTLLFPPVWPFLRGRLKARATRWVKQGRFRVENRWGGAAGPNGPGGLGGPRTPQRPYVDEDDDNIIDV